MKILDMCCGSKMFWFDKNNSETVYIDSRILDDILCDGRKLIVKPDIVMDFRNLGFNDDSFNLVVFDPPHLKKLGKGSWMAKKYGVLSDTWEDDLSKGFQEGKRVLKKDGVLIFKWNERDIKIKKIIEIFKQQPLFGHTTTRNELTKWLCFVSKSDKVEEL